MDLAAPCYWKLAKMFNRIEAYIAIYQIESQKKPPVHSILIQIIERMVALEPHNGHYRFIQGQILTEMGHPLKAIDALEAAKKADPNYKMVNYFPQFAFFFF